MKIDPGTFLLLDAAVPEQRAQWLDLWHRWPAHDVVAHPVYVQLFARTGDRVVCACQGGVESGILFPLIVRPLSAEPWGRGDDKACDLVSAYGYGGPFGWGTNHVETFWAGFDRWAETIHAVSLFTRFSLFKEQLIPFFGDTHVKGNCVVVSLSLESDALLHTYARTARGNVGQAERAGVTIEIDLTGRRLEEFLHVYNSTMNRLEALPMYYFPRPFFERLLKELPDQVLFVHALYAQRVVSTELLLISGSHLYSFLGGTVEEGLPLRANPYLRHSVNLWGRAQNKHHVVLGGAYGSDDSLLRYKQRFAPNGIMQFCVGSRIFDSHAYHALIEKRAAWERAQAHQWAPPAGFFPAYRG